ncbi:MAG: thiazole biosynthesis adenylyltransferase ThiF [Planctomycetaceae bacterium]|nr:MAG: thiazole biosynthesis adenylyltransferase ThiF [Planctomycetaceae bacterium]
MLFAGIGVEGQRRIRSARILICGCGALGSAVADGLTRAGAGFLRIVDRDFVELSNLQRQVLFDEDDVAQAIPKAIAASRKLRRVNSQVEIEPIVADIDPGNILQFTRDVDLIVDGMDNFETRFLINDAALELAKPWIYAGCIGSHGQIMPIFPGQTACLRCLIGEIPGAGETETCDTAGVIGPAIGVVAALEVTLALKILAGGRAQVAEALTVLDVWEPSLRNMRTGGLRAQSDCPACVHGARDWLRGERGSQSTVLCGRNAVQISPAEKRKLSLPEVAERLSAVGTVTHNAFLLRFELPAVDQRITLFPDGRAIIQGTDDPATARGIYAKYVGA